jgi:hypothetical protein
MTCDAAEPWLIATRSADDLPDAVRAHFTGCPHCGGLLARLTRLDAAAAKLAPPPNPTARARLDAALARTPQPTPPTPRRPRSRSVLPWAVAVAVVVMFACGWLTGRLTSSKPLAQVPPEPREQPKEQRPSNQTHPERVLPVAPFPAAPAGLMARAARHAASAAGDPAPVAQAEALDRFAAEVRAAALKHAAAGDVDDLPRLAGVHDRVVRLGVARQVARIPDGLRASVAVAIADELRRSADELTTVSAQLPPAVGDLLHPLFATCCDAGEAIRQGKPPAAPATDWPNPPTPLEAVAAQTIRMADTADPLARADESVRLAAVLAQSVTVLSVAGLPDDAARVGESIDAVLDRGVAANLERVERADPDGKLRKQVAEVRERAGRATEVLEKNLAKAPPAARVGLERALAASDSGRAKATGKGWGPPWKWSDGHPGKGWQKKP